VPIGGSSFQAGFEVRWRPARTGKAPSGGSATPATPTWARSEARLAGLGRHLAEDGRDALRAGRGLSDDVANVVAGLASLLLAEQMLGWDAFYPELVGEREQTFDWSFDSDRPRGLLD
jgi:hypothetical protein